MTRSERSRFTLRDQSKLAGLAGASLALGALFVGAYYPDQKGLLALLAAAAVALLLGFVVAERRVLARVPGSRAARHGANAVAITLAFGGILVILNVLAVRHNGKWDLTADQRFTLSEQTRKVLRGLSAEVNVTAFFSEASEERAAMKRLLDDLAEETTHLRVRFVDPDRDPALAGKHGIREYGTTVFESGAQTYRTTDVTEEAATNALVRVTREGRKTVYFLAGHGEHGLADTQRGGYSAAAQALEAQGYQAKELLLLRDARVPEECDVLVVPGPTKPLLEDELAAVAAYLDQGGRAVVLVDPGTATGLEGLLAAWGVAVQDNVIVDTMSRLFGGSYTTPILTDYPPHEITKDFRLATFLPLARGLAQGTVPEGATFQVLARTTPQSWGETDFKSDKASFDPAQDHPGPLAAIALVEKPGADGAAGTQLVVVGDSDFADNTYFGFSGNGDLFQNLIGYLAREADLIAIRPKDARPSPLMLTRAQGATLFYGSVVVGPLLLALAGLAIWWRRRNL